jgi:hypothetical protein
MNVMGFNDSTDMTFEISNPIDGNGRDDRVALYAWFDYWRATRTPMIGFNNLGFDYPVLHFLNGSASLTVYDIYDYAMSIIRSGNRFSHIVWESDRFAPQIDLFKIHHLDNPAKATSLKALQVNMRSESVMEMPIAFDTPLTREQIDKYLIPYNKHDVSETRKFAHFSMDAINFRLGLVETLRGDVLNFNDTKIGAKILEQRLGDDLCYDRSTGIKRPRQTPRSRIPLNDIIFPYVQFRSAEFNRVLSWMRTQTLSEDEMSGKIKTKGTFTGVSATLDGFEFHFGTGGIHGSVNAQKIVATPDELIIDIDVASLYPNIAIQNELYPEHLGHRFVEEYANLPKERKEWQAKKGKKCTEANSMKLASNGTYGNSNNPYSVFYDPRFTMTVTINGQLLLCMLAEWLLTVPTLKLIQINTDGITYRIHPSQREHARIIQRIWERTTRLVLEEAEYSRMWIRDVNNYVAQSLDGKLKTKGAYWFPVKFPDDIAHAQPPAWHKDFSNIVSTMAAVEHMVNGVDIERFIYSQGDPFLFMCRAKCDRSSKLMIGDQEVQRICRYYVALNGGDMKKVSPPVGTPGEYKRKNGISDFEWHTVLQEIGPGVHDLRIHTKNKSKYETREMSIESGFKVADCSVASDFDFQNVNYEWYVQQARKLVIG